MSTRNRFLVAVLAAALALVAVALGSRPPGASRTAAATPASPSLVPSGVTVRTAPTPPAVRAGRRAHARALGGRVLLQADRRTGGVRRLARLDGRALTGPGRGPARERVLGYVRSHEQVFGLDAGDLRGLHLMAERRDPDGRVVRLRWQQRAGGIPLLEGDLRATVASDGRILSLGGGALADLAERAILAPRLTAAEAYRIAARATGGDVVAPALRDARRDGDRRVRFAGGHQAALVHTAATGRVRLAWRVIRRQSGDEVYDQLIDALTGDELSRRQRVRHASGHVFDNYPGAPQGGAGRLVSFGSDLSSSTALVGPTAQVIADANGNDEVDPGESIGPSSTGGDWNYPRKGQPGTGCPAVGCSWIPGVEGSWKINKEQAATQLFHHLRTFRAHLAAAPIGFDDFRGEDKVDARALFGAHGGGGFPIEGALNNAGMYTPPEGESPSMRMYLWASTQRPIPANHAGDDASVVYHEYAHGLIGRLVIDATGWMALGLRQSGAIDEGVADVYALDYLVAKGLEADTAAPGEVRIGKHVDPNNTGVRSQPVDCPVGSGAPACPGTRGAGPGGYTYGDFAKIAGEHEPHKDGEIITQTLWDLRTRLVADRGALQGVRRLRSLLTLALRETPTESSFLDLRNALLTADAAPGAGGDAERIWAAFAARGMGWFASAEDGDDAAPKEDFSLPPGTGAGSISGTVTGDETGAPLAGAVVSLGGHDSGEIYSGDIRARTGADGHYEIAGLPDGTYGHVTVQRTGYEMKVLRDVVVAGGGAATASATLRRNWADVGAGAVVGAADGEELAGRGCAPARAFDGDRTSGWTAHNNGLKRVELTLPATVTISSFALDPSARCTAGQESAVRRVTVEVAGEGSETWGPGVVFRTGTGSSYRVSEQRPPAALEDVRRIRVTMHGAIDPGTSRQAMSELMVFASRKAPPRAAFDWEPQLPDVDDEITLDASASRPGSAPITRHEWDLDGDGAFDVDTGANATTTISFPSGGRHAVRLKVTTAEGQTDEVRNVLSVGMGVEVFDLGSLEPDEGGRAHANGITRRGIVVGQTNPVPGRWKAFVYRGGDMEELRQLPGHDYGVALNANDNGLSAGMSALGTTERRAVVWNGTEPTDVGTLGGRHGAARDVNDANIVIGWADDERNSQRPFIKTPGAPMRDIDELAGIPEAQRGPSAAWRMNESAVVVGCRGAFDTNCTGKAFRYDHATRTATDLADLGHGAAAFALNDAGVAAGWARAADHSLKPARWSESGAFEALETLGGPSGAGVQVAPDGTVWGAADDASGEEHAARWAPGSREPQDLNDLVRGTGWTLTAVDDVNARGEAVGWGVNERGGRRAFQLSTGPCPMCVAGVELSERDVVSGDWRPAGADGVVDGNQVRATVKVRNADDQPHIAQVRGVDEHSDETLEGSGAPISLDPGEEGEVSLYLDTEDLAWDDEGRPDSDHVLRFRLTLGHTVFGSRGAALKVRPKPAVLVHGMTADAATWSAYGEFAARAHPDWRTRRRRRPRPRRHGHRKLGRPARRAEHDRRQRARPRRLPARRARGRERRARRPRRALDGGPDLAALHPGRDARARPRVARAAGRRAPRPDRQPRTAARRVRTSPASRSSTSCAPTSPRASTPRSPTAAACASRSWPATRCRSRATPARTATPSSACRARCGRSPTARWAARCHTDMTGSGAIFTTYVKPRLAGEVEVPLDPAPGLRSRAARVAEEPGAVRPRSHELLARHVVAVAPGTAPAEARLEVDGGARLEVMLLADRVVSTELVAPDGTVAARSEAGTRESRSMYRRLVADSPAAGAWRVRLLTAGDVPTSAQVSARLVDDRWSLDLIAGRAAAGAATPLVATVVRDGRRLAGASVTAARC